MNQNYSGYKLDNYRLEILAPLDSVIHCLLNTSQIIHHAINQLSDVGLLLILQDMVLFLQVQSHIHVVVVPKNAIFDKLTQPS